jgi:tRNA(Ile)-lysidine synthase
MDRNYLRLHVLPSLRRRWPHADAALAAGARACGEASDLLAAGDSIALEEVRGADDALDVVALKAVQPARRARVLRAWIASLDLPPLPAEGLRRIEHDLLQARADANARFAWHGAVVRRWRDRLYAHRSITPLDSGWSCQWMGDAELPLPDGGSLRLDPPVRLPAPVCVRGRRGGERIRLPGRAHRHVLKHVLQELGIPPWERERLPLLVGMDGDVMAVGDRVASHAFQAWLDDAGVRLVWTPPACRR